MIDKKGPVQPKLFTYVRYNADLSQFGLRASGLDNIAPKAEEVQKLDSVKHISELQRIGEKAAQKVQRSHFAQFLE